jgi:hypothetical protein
MRAICGDDPAVVGSYLAELAAEASTESGTMILERLEYRLSNVLQLRHRGRLSLTSIDSFLVELCSTYLAGPGSNFHFSEAVLIVSNRALLTAAIELAIDNPAFPAEKYRIAPGWCRNTNISTAARTPRDPNSSATPRVPNRLPIIGSLSTRPGLPFAIRDVVTSADTESHVATSDQWNTFSLRGGRTFPFSAAIIGIAASNR